MRTRLNPQDPWDFSPSSLMMARNYHEKYSTVDKALAATPQILSTFDREISRVLSKKGCKREAELMSDNLLRTILVMEIEGLPYRGTVVRIDDSRLLRRFVRVFDDCKRRFEPPPGGGSVAPWRFPPSAEPRTW
jgi:hypothetical protein